MSVSLKAGANLVVYTGKAQPTIDAFDSILPYLEEPLYYFNNFTKAYESVIQMVPVLYIAKETMIPYGVYWIVVTQNCTWTYGADATAPDSVQLYTGWNYVAYTGPAQPVEDALALISPYVSIIYYYDTYQGWREPTSMVPNKAYVIKVDRNCVWTFVAPAVVPCEITITAPNSAAEDEKVSVSALLKNVSSYGSMYKTEISAVPDLFPAFRIGTIEKYINSGSSFTAYGSFTMPASNTTILIWVERWAVDHWVYDNSASKVVSLEAVPTTFHLSVFVPSWAAGGYVEPGSGDYPANTTIALRAYPLSGYQFTSWGGDASGTALTYNLYMNSDKNVEAYFEKIPVPEYKGSIARKELEYDETRGAIPVY